MFASALYAASIPKLPFVRLTYSEMNGENVNLGQLTSDALSMPAHLRGDFDDMKSWRLNLGTRLFFGDSATIRPYVAGYLGAEREDALRARLSLDTVHTSPGVENAVFGSQEWMPQSTRFDAGVEGGVSFQLSDTADLRVSAGANYVASRHVNTAAFAPLGLDEVRLTNQSWSIPVDMSLAWRF